MGVGVVQSRVGSAALRYGGRAQRPQQRVRRRHFAARRAVLCGRWLGGWWPRERATPVAAALAAATVATATLAAASLTAASLAASLAAFLAASFPLASSAADSASSSGEA